MGKSLTALQVNAIKLPGKYADGVIKGLYLFVRHTSDKMRVRKSWLLRYSFNNKRRDMGLGSYPEIGLAEAREIALEHRNKLAKGIDPLDLKRETEQQNLKAKRNEHTFKQAAEVVIENKRPGWKNAKHADQWANTLITYAYPTLGSMICSDIDLNDIQRVLDPIWTTKTETANRVRQRIETVLDFATVKGWREGTNPAKWKGNLDHIYQPRNKVQKVKNFEALPYSRVNDLWVELSAHKGVATEALKFTILTAARSGMVRAMTWNEVDLQKGIWTIPAEKMKAGKEFSLPLSDEALKILTKQSTEGHDQNNVVFPSLRGKPLSDAGMSAVLKRMGLNVTVHGFRSTFRDWAAEQTSYANELCEYALAHAVSDKTEAAYRRGDMIEKRTKLMTDWASYILKPKIESMKVTTTRGAA